MVQVATESLVSPGVGKVSYLSSLVLDLPSKAGGTQKVRLLLDGCATDTYGLDRCIDNLQVTETGTGVDMTVSSFNGPRQVSSRMVELQLPGGIPLNIIVSNYICEPLRGHNLHVDVREKLKDFPLGDPACVQEGELPIDILVGVDNFWKLATDQITRLTSDLVVMSTRFGYVLSGKMGCSRSSVMAGTHLAHALLCSPIQLHGSGVLDSQLKSESHSLCTHEVESLDNVVDIIKEVGETCDLDSHFDVKEVKSELGKVYDLDTLAIKPDRDVSPVLEDVSHTLCQDPVSQLCTVRLPWKGKIMDYTSIFTSSLHQLDSLRAKFLCPHFEDFASQYQAVMIVLVLLSLLVPQLLYPKLCSCICESGRWVQLSSLGEVVLQRSLSLHEDDHLELHGFSDASQAAYDATIYIKSSRGSESSCQLIMCGSRVALWEKLLSLPTLFAQLIVTIVLLFEHQKRYMDSITEFSTRLWVVFELEYSEPWFHGPDLLVIEQSLQDVDFIHPSAVCLQGRKSIVRVMVPDSTGIVDIVRHSKLIYWSDHQFIIDPGDMLYFTPPELHSITRKRWRDYDD